MRDQPEPSLVSRLRLMVSLRDTEATHRFSDDEWLRCAAALEIFEADYGGHPETIGELRAEAAGGNATKWSARDALIATLRKIDAEQLDVDTLVLCYRVRGKEPGSMQTFFANAGGDAHTALGMLVHSQQRLLAEGEGE